LSPEDPQISETLDHDSRLREQPLESSGDLIECPRTLEQDPSLSPGIDPATNVISATVPEAECECAEVILAEASTLHSPRSSTTVSSPSRPLHDYIRQHILEINCDYIDDEADKQYILRYQQSSMNPDLCRVGHPVLKVFLEHAMPRKLLQMIARDLDSSRYDLALLQSLLLSGREFPIWVAFSLSLLHAAVVDGNFLLVHVVGQTGVDIDAQLPLEYRHNLRGKCVLVYSIPEELTPLQIAVLCRRGAIVKALSGFGATILTGNRDSDWRFLKDAYGQSDLLQPLLSRLTISRNDTARRGLELLDLAVRRADSTMIDVLLRAGFNPFKSLDVITDFGSIRTFEQVSQEIPTPFMVALDMCREEHIRLDKDPMSASRSCIIIKLLSFNDHEFDGRQRREQLQLPQVALAYAFAALADDHELQHALIENTGFYRTAIETTIRNHSWGMITKVGPIPSPWAMPEVEAPLQKRPMLRIEL